LAFDVTWARDFPALPLKLYIHIFSTAFLVDALHVPFKSNTMSIPSFITASRRKMDVKSTNGATTKPVNPLSCPESSAPFSAELFKSPTSEYRGCPFWAWNNKLDKAQLLRQIDHFEAMGMGGFHVTDIPNPIFVFADTQHRYTYAWD
jgi:hypothetical protein